MKTKFFLALVSLASVGPSFTWAQNVDTVASPGQTPANAPDKAAMAQEIVYADQLPTVKELNKAAAAKSITVEKIEPSKTEVVAFYKYNNGQKSKVVYRLKPPAPTPTPAK